MGLEWIANNGDTIVGGVAGLSGVWLGHWLTLWHQHQKGQALEQAMYSEVEIMTSDLTDWLGSLIDEMKRPVRTSYSGIGKFDADLLMALIVELVSVKKTVTVEQRKFIIRMMNKLDGIYADDVHRTQETNQREKENPPDAPFNVPTRLTAHLLVDVAESIFFLTKFLADKRSFTTQQTAEFAEMAEIACRQAKLDFEPAFWERVHRLYAPQP